MRRDRVLRALVALPLLVGCGPGGPVIAPVTGVVTLDGEPVADAGVLFTPMEPGPSASASTDSEGRYRLATGDRDGAVVGQHRIIVSKAETVGVSAEEGEVSGMMSPNWRLIRSLPDRYARPDTSGLTADVVAGETNEVPLALTDTPPKEPTP